MPTINHPRETRVVTRDERLPMPMTPLNRVLSRLFHAVSPGYALLSSPFIVALSTWLLLRIQTALLYNCGGHRVRPFTMGYLIPLIFLTALGGRFVGIVTLAEAAGAAIYVLTTPALNWQVENVHDRAEIGMLILVGAVLVFAVGALRQRVDAWEDLPGSRLNAAQTERVEREVRAVAGAVEGVAEIGHCVIRRWGLDYYVALLVFVSGDVSVGEARLIASRVEDAVCAANPLIQETRVQVEPESGWKSLKAS